MAKEMILNIRLCYARPKVNASKTVGTEYFRARYDNPGHELKDEELIRPSAIRECVY